MTEHDSTLATFYTQWDEYQERLTQVVAPLSSAQLALSSAPHLRTVGAIASHIIGARARWFHNLLGEGGEDVAALAQLDRQEAPGWNAAELVDGLQTTRKLMQEGLERWTPADMEEVFTGVRNGESYSLSRQWVIWHLIEHDLHHGGELSLTLGMHNIPALDL